MDENYTFANTTLSYNTLTQAPKTFESASTLYMVTMITCLCIVKDFLFGTIEGGTSSVERFFPAFPKSRKTTSFGLLMSCLISLSLVILHSKGALIRLVDSISSTDFLATYKIILSTIEVVLVEIVEWNSFICSSIHLY